MKIKRNLVWIFPILLAGCSTPFSVAPTEFVFPTADYTQAAIFQPTATAVPTDTPEPTATATEFPSPTATEVPPTDTVSPEPTRTETSAPIPQPPDSRGNPHILAQYVKEPPSLNGSWGDWVAEVYPADNVVYGRDNWKEKDDLSADVMVEWDEEYLYVAWKVRDDRYVQYSKGYSLYKGDSVEIVLDTHVKQDYGRNWLDGDDYQIGISPGRDEPGEHTEAYLWFPQSKQGSLTDVIIGVKGTDTGYRLTAAIPWDTFDIDPHPDMHLGFAASVSDDDSNQGGVQQSMVSTTGRVLTDPTTWSDLVLVK